ncbi:MAG: M48 family metallopeptidase [Campylobacterales bacterium]|nr:M48 family metallopeptidase [Campylobacterales bacterium]
MLTLAIGIYTLYILVRVYVSVMQIGYLSQARLQKAVLLAPEEYLEAGSYAISKERLGLVSTVVEFALFIFWISLGISWLDGFFSALPPLWHTIIFVLGFVVLNSLVSLPFDLYQKFVIDEAYGFNKSTAGLYIKDTLISTALMLIVGALVIWGVDEIMNRFEMWWLYSFAFIFGVIVLINMLFPTVRALFFDKVTPLKEGELKESIEEMMQKTGFASSGVFVSDASKRDSRLNAYFGGLGKTKRVVLFDTLIEKLSAKELLAVLGHELGHFAHGDIYKNMGMMGMLLFAMFALFGNLSENLFLQMGVAATPGVVMVLFMLFMPVLGFVMMPLLGLVSRHNEFEADKTGAELGGGEHLASALQKLVSENKSFPLSHPVYIFFNYTHPPVIERLKALGVEVVPSHSDARAGACPEL